jgi:hypothetical protein
VPVHGGQTSSNKRGVPDGTPLSDNTAFVVGG